MTKRSAVVSSPENLVPETSKSGISDTTRKFLYPEEVEHLITRAKENRKSGTRDACMILVAWVHGLRVSELLSLEWSNVDWKSHRLFIKRAKGSNDSIHPLYEREEKLLRKLKRKADEKEKKEGVSIPWVFPSSHSQKMDVSTFRKLLYSLSTGLPVKTHPHMLRHSCGFKLINEGRDLRVIQEYLGHVNICNTVRYTKLSTKHFDGLWK